MRSFFWGLFVLFFFFANKLQRFIPSEETSNGSIPYAKFQTGKIF